MIELSREDQVMLDGYLKSVNEQPHVGIGFEDGVMVCKIVANNTCVLTLDKQIILKFRNELQDVIQHMFGSD